MFETGLGIATAVYELDTTVFQLPRPILRSHGNRKN